jgi:hypothetical protein
MTLEKAIEQVRKAGYHCIPYEMVKSLSASANVNYLDSLRYHDSEGFVRAHLRVLAANLAYELIHTKGITELTSSRYVDDDMRNSTRLSMRMQVIPYAQIDEDFMLAQFREQQLKQPI